jgi:hypothetical protein
VFIILNLLVSKIPEPDFLKNKLGGPGCMVQIDENMLNYKCKSYQGRSAKNQNILCALLNLMDELQELLHAQFQQSFCNTSSNNLPTSFKWVYYMYRRTSFIWVS